MGENTKQRIGEGGFVVEKKIYAGMVTLVACKCALSVPHQNKNKKKRCGLAGRSCLAHNSLNNTTICRLSM